MPPTPTSNEPRIPPESRPADVPGYRLVTDGGELRLGAAVGDRDEFAFHATDGVDSPDAFRTAELHLLDVLAEEPPESLLVPQANYGVVGVVMAAFDVDVRMTETNVRRARLCHRNAVENGVGDRASVVVTDDPRAVPADLDTAAFAPAAYEPIEVVQRRLTDAVEALVHGGAVYLSAPETAGLNRYERTLAELCDGVETVDDRDGCPVIRATVPDEPPGEDRAEGDDPRFAEPRTITPTVRGTDLTLVTRPGLFSASSLDDGTRELVRHLADEAVIRDGDRVLDLACGYGPLGVYAALTADCDVTMTDVDCVSTASARRSAHASGVADAVRVVIADGTRGVAGERFDRIVSNPPTHAGSAVLHGLMRGARDVLAPDGRIDLVHHQGVPFDQYLGPYFDRTTVRERGEYAIVTARP